MAAVETPQGEIEHLRKVLDEVQTNQAEHASHLDHLAHRADLERTKRATDSLRLNGLAQEVKELRDKIRNAEQEAKEGSKNCQKSCGLCLNGSTTRSNYRRMVGNLFRRVADAVDGG